VTSGIAPIRPSRPAILERNRIEYDDVSDPYWERTVYEATHDGWRFSNIGGKAVLERIAQKAALSRSDTVLELCSGPGDASRYLALRTGCSVTGVEMNAHQYHSAVAQVKKLPQGALRFIHADVEQWFADRTYDAVFCLDALMYLKGRRRTVQRVAQGLRFGGKLFAAEILAGAAIPKELCRFMWKEDGILNLPTPEGQRAMFLEAGLTAISWEGLTELAVRCFQNMERASECYRKELIAAKGAARFLRWVHNARIYRQAFEKGYLIYGLMAGERGGAA
jgi:cyclopropane fatty-acyl-phospholipid synthase-like methyltransferase